MGENPESNREPLVPQTNVLPIELFPPLMAPRPVRAGGTCWGPKAPTSPEKSEAFLGEKKRFEGPLRGSLNHRPRSGRRFFFSPGGAK